MKYSNLRAFEKHLEGSASPRTYAPVYMILAKEGFERKIGSDRLIASLLQGEATPEFCTKVFDGGDNIVLSQLMDELQALSFFSSRKVILINQAEKLLKPVTEALTEYYANPNPSTYLVISASAINHATNFYKKAEKIGVVLDIAEEKAWEKEKSLKEWIATHVVSKGIKIDLQVCEGLLKQVGIDQTLLFNELEKLFCYIGDRREIRMEDVKAICTKNNVENSWQLGEAIFRRDVSSAIKISKALLADGTPFLVFLRQIRSQFQTDYQVCCTLNNGGTSQDIAKMFPYMKGFILDRHMQMAKGYGLAAFKKGMLKIDEMELLSKSNVQDFELLAELLIIKLTEKSF